MGQFPACPVAEPVLRSFDDQWDSRGDWTLCPGGRERYLCTGEGMAPGRDPDTDADCGDGWGGCESGGHCLDPASAESA